MIAFQLKIYFDEVTSAKIHHPPNPPSPNPGII
jgi:hypothetical protein